MSSYETELDKASKTFQKQISETQEKIGETTRQVERSRRAPTPKCNLASTCPKN